MMGRKKISIGKIADPRARHTTFNKRKVGLMKKAIELSVLCDCELALVVFYEGQLYQFASSGDMEATLQRHGNFEGPQEILEVNDLDELRPGKASSFKVGKLCMKRKLSPLLTFPSSAGFQMSESQKMPVQIEPNVCAESQPPSKKFRKMADIPTLTAVPESCASPDVHSGQSQSKSLLAKRGRMHALSVQIPVPGMSSVAHTAQSQGADSVDYAAPSPPPPGVAFTPLLSNWTAEGRCASSRPVDENDLMMSTHCQHGGPLPSANLVEGSVSPGMAPPQSMILPMISPPLPDLFQPQRHTHSTGSSGGAGLPLSPPVYRHQLPHTLQSSLGLRSATSFPFPQSVVMPSPLAYPELNDHQRMQLALSATTPTFSPFPLLNGLATPYARQFGARQ